MNHKWLVCLPGARTWLKNGTEGNREEPPEPNEPYILLSTSTQCEDHASMTSHVTRGWGILNVAVKGKGQNRSEKFLNPKPCDWCHTFVTDVDPWIV